MGASIPAACWRSSLEGERAKVGEARPGRGDWPRGCRGESGRAMAAVSRAEKAVRVPGLRGGVGW